MSVTLSNDGVTSSPLDETDCNGAGGGLGLLEWWNSS